MQPAKTELRGGFLLGGACLIVIIAGLKAAQELVIPVVFSAFLAIISAPLVFWLKRRVPDVVAVVIVVVAVLAALLGLAGVVGGSVNTFVTEAPRYKERFQAILSATLGWLDAHGMNVSPAKLEEVMDPTAAIGLLGGTITQLASVLSDAFLVILTLVFLLFEVTVLPAKLRAALGDPRADLGRYTNAVAEINHYVVLKTYVSLATGAIVWLMLWCLGVDFSLLWGLLAFLLNFVPNIGSIIAAVPPVLLALLQFGPGRALAVLAGFVVINMVIGNAVEPRVMGRRLGLSTLVVFLSLVFWGWLWGGMGMLLSVPLTMILKIGLENSEEWQWVAVLMDGEVPADMGSPSSLPLSRRDPLSGPGAQRGASATLRPRPADPVQVASRSSSSGPPSATGGAHPAADGPASTPRPDST